MDLFDKHGGYRKLDSFTLVSIIQLGTWRFCERFLDRKNDPAGRQFDQMTQTQGDRFRKEGGFRERMMAIRLEEREKAQADAPLCPECGKPMRKRTAKTGQFAGKPFWGCTAYPECKGTQEVKGEG